MSDPSKYEPDRLDSETTARAKVAAREVFDRVYDTSRRRKFLNQLSWDGVAAISLGAVILIWVGSFRRQVEQHEAEITQLLVAQNSTDKTLASVVQWQQDHEDFTYHENENPPAKSPKGD